MRDTRRNFLADVGRGVLTVSLGPALAADLGAGLAGAAAGPDELTFGRREPLVRLLQETHPDKLLPLLVEKLRQGTDLDELVAAAALANARTFGGEDYVGFHTFMALMPARAMARELPTAHQPLPVLKVLHRNSRRITEKGGRKHEVLHPVAPGDRSPGQSGAEALRQAVRARDGRRAEETFAALSRGPVEDALNDLLPTVQDDTEVHRVVLAYRAWDLLGLVGREQAHTLLRQSVRYCLKAETWPRQASRDRSRSLLPKLLDQYRLAGGPPRKRPAEDAWVERMSETLFRSSPEQAADAAAAALAEGIDPDAVGEAISLAANQLVLRDAGRPPQQAQPGKPVGSVHGDSIGVHASDSANAWRNLARVANARNRVACLILGAYQVALDRGARGGDFLHWQPYPRPEHLEKLTARDAAGLLRTAEEAIRAGDQSRACAAIQRYGLVGGPARSAFDLLLRYAVSEDGALHAEKYYRTTSDEFAATRPAFRWRQLIALARVTASAHGQPAPGLAEARRLLKV